MDIDIQNPQLREAAAQIRELIAQNNGKTLLVGGCVRDSILGVPVKDLDLEVYGLSPQKLKSLLESRFKVSLVGEAFGVIKIHGLPVDIALPRRESKAALGHKGFEVMSDPAMSVREAASRRDFTVNAMAFDLDTGDLHDYFGGEKDLGDNVLRHTSEKFVEDPLRVLRGMQFAARFDLTPDPETVRLCATIQPEGLASERIFEEWKKLVLHGTCPSRGLAFLKDTGWLQYYPELETMVGCEQDPEWHPEGDVWTHTLMCMDAFPEERVDDEREDLIVGLAVLCHDLGKPLTSEYKDGHIRSMGHSESGKAPTRSFLSRMSNQDDLSDAVTALVTNHMRPTELHNSDAGDSAIRRLARRVGRIDRLVRVARADKKGIGNTDPGFPAGDWLLKRALELKVQDSVPKPVVMGRHLIELGLAPGPDFGPILDACYEAQLDGTITHLDEGINHARQLMANTCSLGKQGET